MSKFEVTQWGSPRVFRVTADGEFFTIEEARTFAARLYEAVNEAERVAQAEAKQATPSYVSRPPAGDRMVEVPRTVLENLQKQVTGHGMCIDGINAKLAHFAEVERAHGSSIARIDRAVGAMQAWLTAAFGEFPTGKSIADWRAGVDEFIKNVRNYMKNV